MTEEPPLDAKCRDKFLVQSVAVSASDEISNVATVVRSHHPLSLSRLFSTTNRSNTQKQWQNIETNARSSIQEKKIRVNFLPASSSSTSNTTSNGAAPNNSTDTPNRSMLEDQPPAYSSPTAASGQTPQSINKYDTKDTTRGIDTDPAAHATSTSGTASSAGAGTVAAAANTVTAAVPTTSEELKTQLATAQEKISSLTAQANEGVRQRKNAASGSGGSGEGSGVGSGGLAMQQTAGGVPVPVVAGLCLLSFLLAYLLF